VIRADASTIVSARAVARCLDDLAAVLERTSDADYVAKPPGGISGSVGAHVRHCLDHVHALLDRADDGPVSYDQRRRQAAIEEGRQLAVSALRAAGARLQALAPHLPAGSVTLRAQVDRDGSQVEASSTIARELVFLLQHTIHHQALVALLLAGRGVVVPHLFGYAPSTPRSAA
jgi:uncharacterized damage-inducible protein DinB